MKIALGTVQFGLNYGISNQEGQTSPDEVSKILDVAREYCVSVIDTAALYGNSEEILGRSLPNDHPFRIVTKTIRIDSDRITASDADRVESAFIESLEKLRCYSVYGLMFHNADDLLAEGGEMIMERLQCLKKSGRVSKIGASVYTADQIDKILSRFEIDLIQLPINVLDQRLLAGGQLSALKSRGVEIHARSVFLQGLLLMDPDTLGPHFDLVKKHLKQYQENLYKLRITPVQAALYFVTMLDEIDAVICGVNNHQQLEELCLAATRIADFGFNQYAISDDSILNPSKWPGIS